MGDTEAKQLFLQLVAEHEARGGDGVAGIVDLMASIEPRQRQVEQTRLGLKYEAPLLLVHVEVAAGDMQGHAELLGARFDHGERLALLAADNARHACFKMPAFSPAIAVRLSPRKLTWSIEIGVIAVASGFSTTLVASSLPPRPVSSSSKSAGVSAKARKAAAVVISNSVMSSPPFAASARARQSTRSIFADRRAMAAGVREHDALMKIDEMRRGIDVDAIALRFGDGAQEGDERALAVGAGDMEDRRQPLLGRAERGKQPLDAAKRKIDRFRVQRFQAIEQRRACRNVEARRARLPAIG